MPLLSDNDGRRETKNVGLLLMTAFATSNAVQHLFSVGRVISPLVEEERVRNLFLLILSSDHLALLLNAGSLTGEVTEIVKFSATYLTYLIDLDAVNGG